MQDYKKLDVWKAAHNLALNTYKATKIFPKEELYGLTSQIRRSSASVPSNIAEGCGREGRAELGRFLQIALGSVNEAEYQLLLAHDLGFLNTTDHESLNNQANKVKGMLISLIQRVEGET